jgi:hypothetical protein
LHEDEVMDLFHGEEKNVFQMVDLGDEIEEMEEMYI